MYLPDKFRVSRDGEPLKAFFTKEAAGSYALAILLEARRPVGVLVEGHDGETGRWHTILEMGRPGVAGK